MCVCVCCWCFRDLKFYLSIEQALLCGDPLLVEGVTTPFDPALQPLLEMHHTWSNTGTVYYLCKFLLPFTEPLSI